MKTIILDTESNGMKPEQVCQLAYIKCVGGAVSGHNFYFSVDTMNDYALKKHRLSKSRLFSLSSGRTFEQRFTEFWRDLVEADVIVGHNIAADMRMLDIEAKRLNLEPLQAKTFCTMQHYQTAMHLRGRTGQRKPPRLEELCRYFRVDDVRIEKACQKIFRRHNAVAHDARFDATATYLFIYEAQLRGDIKGVI